MKIEAISNKLSTHIGKYDGLFARMCVVFHCIEHSHRPKLPSTINEHTAERVERFCKEFLLKHAVAFYSGILGWSQDDDKLTAIAGYILAHELDEITFRDISRGDRAMRSLDRDQSRRLLEKLEFLGWVDGTSPQKTRR